VGTAEVMDRRVVEKADELGEKDHDVVKGTLETK